MKGLLLCGTVGLIACPAASAAFPGQNGKLAWAIDDTELGDRLICTGVPGGEQSCRYGTTSLIQDGPAWSSDGSRMALMTFWEDGEIALRNADGSGETLITNTLDDADDEPAWSPGDTYLTFSRDTVDGRDVYAIKPDGTGAANLTNHPAVDVSSAPGPTGRIAFTSNRGGNFDVYVMDRDGGNVQQLTHTAAHEGTPNWSPDGSKIAFTSNRDGNTELYVMDEEGDNETRLTATPADNELDPAWSPDGLQIAFLLMEPWWDGGGSVNKIDADGSNRQTLFWPRFGTDEITTGLDWQPLPVATPSAYARPKSALRVQFSLVPAYEECAAPNREHGPPLASPSCAPPKPASPALVVSDGETRLRSAGFVRLKVTPGVPGGVDDTTGRVRMNLTNVMRAADLSDYPGELRGSVRVRITDTEGVVSQTVQDLPLEWTVPCVPTASTLDGSVCDIASDLDALVPGATPERTRAVWGLEQAKVYDGGPDEDADTEADNALFATQGVFVP